jgi:hypothetical protein
MMSQSTSASVSLNTWRNWSGPASAQMHFDLFLRGADVLFNYMRTSVELEKPVL